MSIKSLVTSFGGSSARSLPSVARGATTALSAPRPLPHSTAEALAPYGRSPFIRQDRPATAAAPPQQPQTAPGHAPSLR
jgi:hypothetical protein